MKIPWSVDEIPPQRALTMNSWFSTTITSYHYEKPISKQVPSLLKVSYRKGMQN